MQRLTSVILVLCMSGLCVGQDQNRVDQAVQHIRGGRLAAATEVLRQVTESEPENTRAWFLLGFASHAQQDYVRAGVAFRRALADTRFTGRATYNLACIHALQGQREPALAMLRKSVELNAASRTQLLTDSDLRSLQGDPQFAELLPEPVPDDELFVEDGVEIIRTFPGEAANDEFGWVARRVGDIDNDSVTDFVTTAPSFSGGAGKVYVYSSRTGELLFDHTGAAGERLGNGAAGAGDFNGDGTPDVIVGAPRNGPDAHPGRVYVLSGSDGAVLHQWEGEAAGDRFGYKVCGLGDLDGDGCAEVAISAIAADGHVADCGKVYAYSGGSGLPLFELNGEQGGDKFGSALTGSEDDRPRLVVGAQDAGEDNAGSVYVYELESGEPAPAFVISPEEGNVELGQMFVSFPGDVDGDGVNDVCASDFSDRAIAPITGSVRVYSGATGREIHVLRGSSVGEGFGTSPGDAGDVDGDGRGDLVIGAWQNSEGAASGGRVYLYSGASARLLQTWTCREAGDTFGFDAAGIGDVNGDGAIDFLITSAWSSVPHARSGRVFIIAGRSYE